MKARNLIFPVLVLMLFSGCAGPEESVKADCEINDGPCVKTTGGITVAIDINPKPVRTLSCLVFSVSLRRGDGPVTDARVTIDLTMPGMYMGINKIPLAHRGEGKYEGKGAIVRCPSGKRIWKAEVMIEGPSPGGDEVSATYLFEVRE